MQSAIFPPQPGVHTELTLASPRQRNKLLGDYVGHSHLLFLLLRRPDANHLTSEVRRFQSITPLYRLLLTVQKTWMTFRSTATRVPWTVFRANPHKQRLQVGGGIISSLRRYLTIQPEHLSRFMHKSWQFCRPLGTSGEMVVVVKVIGVR